MSKLRAPLALAATALCLLAVPSPARADETWRRVTPNWTWPRAGFDVVAATGPNDVWVGGGQGQLCVWLTTLPFPPSPPVPEKGEFCPVKPKPALQRWDGARWHSYGPGPFSSGDGSVTGIYPHPAGGVYVRGLKDHANGDRIETDEVVVRYQEGRFNTLPVVPDNCRNANWRYAKDRFWITNGHHLCTLFDHDWHIEDEILYSDISADGQIWGLTHAGGFDRVLVRWGAKGWEEMTELDIEARQPGVNWTYYSLTAFGADDVWLSVHASSPGQGTRYHWAHWNGTTLDYIKPEGVTGPGWFFADPVTGRAMAWADNSHWAFDGMAWTPAAAPSEPDQPTPPAGYRITQTITVPGSSVRWAVGRPVSAPDIEVPSAPLVMTTG